MKRTILAAAAAALVAGCAHVDSSSTKVADDTYKVACDGNRRASTDDTQHCVVRQADRVCAPRAFKLSEKHSAVTAAAKDSGAMPHSSAVVTCVAAERDPNYNGGEWDKAMEKADAVLQTK
jgi:hypothetical protein